MKSSQSLEKDAFFLEALGNKKIAEQWIDEHFEFSADENPTIIPLLPIGQFAETINYSAQQAESPEIKKLLEVLGKNTPKDEEQRKRRTEATQEMLSGKVLLRLETLVREGGEWWEMALKRLVKAHGKSLLASHLTTEQYQCLNAMGDDKATWELLKERGQLRWYANPNKNLFLVAPTYRLNGATHCPINDWMGTGADHQLFKCMSPAFQDQFLATPGFAIPRGIYLGPQFGCCAADPTDAINFLWNKITASMNLTKEIAAPFKAQVTTAINNILATAEDTLSSATATKLNEAIWDILLSDETLDQLAAE